MTTIDFIDDLLMLSIAGNAHIESAQSSNNRCDLWPMRGDLVHMSSPLDVQHGVPPKHVTMPKHSNPLSLHSLLNPISTNFTTCDVSFTQDFSMNDENLITLAAGSKNHFRNPCPLPSPRDSSLELKPQSFRIPSAISTAANKIDLRCSLEVKRNPPSSLLPRTPHFASSALSLGRLSSRVYYPAEYTPIPQQGYGYYRQVNTLPYHLHHQRPAPYSNSFGTCGATDFNYRQCSNCGTCSTPSWRRCGPQNEIVCNACGLYFMEHQIHRPFRVDSGGRTKALRVFRPVDSVIGTCEVCKSEKVHVTRRKREPHAPWSCTSCGGKRKR